MSKPNYRAIFRRALKSSKMPVGRFADSLGISRQALHLITSGKSTPSLQTLASLSVQHKIEFYTLIPSPNRSLR